MEYVMIAFLTLVLPLVVGIVVYFMAIHFFSRITPKGIGRLVTSIWTLIIGWIISYLLFLSPPVLKSYFILGDSVGFWAAMIIGFIIIVALWIRSIKNN